MKSKKCHSIKLRKQRQYNKIKKKKSIKMKEEMMKMHDIIVSFECQDSLAKQSLRWSLD